MSDDDRKPTARPEDSKPLVVVIDDDATLLLSMKLILGTNYRTRFCDSGDAGLAAIDDETSAVILDVKMPGKSGFVVYGEIRERYPRLPIIFHSAYQDAKSPYEIINTYRPFGYVFKGSDPEELLRLTAAATKEYLWLRRLERENRRLQEALARATDQAHGAH